MSLGQSQKLLDVNSSSIIDLKAELFRKQEQVRQKLSSKDSVKNEDQNDNVLYQKAENNTKKQLPKRIIETIQQLENKSKRPKSLVEKKPKVEDNETNETEERNLKLSRMNLERKAKLYEQMCKGSVPIDTDDENILVNFQQKRSMSNTYESESDDDSMQLLEYIDQFGRTRMVSREEYERLKEEQKQDEEKCSKNEEEEPSSEDETFQTQERKPTVDIHYQHVREGEVRDHGVAFYAFSEDQETRAKQMEMLDKLRKETETLKHEKQRTKEKRKQMIRNRLEKIAARKGIQLPDEPEEKDTNEDRVDKESIRMERATLKPNKPISQGPREWDLGKEGVPETSPSSYSNKSSKFYSQERYQEKLRGERNPEFAPPQLYFTKNKSSENYSDSTNGTFNGGPGPGPDDEISAFISRIRKS